MKIEESPLSKPSAVLANHFCTRTRLVVSGAVHIHPQVLRAHREDQEPETAVSLRAVLIGDVNFLNFLFFFQDFHEKTAALLSSAGLFVFFFS